jgi:hypothetical protein
MPADTSAESVQPRVVLWAAALMLAIGLASGAALGLAGGWWLARSAAPTTTGPVVPLDPERGFTVAPRDPAAPGRTTSGAPTGPGQG